MHLFAALSVAAREGLWLTRKTAVAFALVLRVDQNVLDELLVDWPELAHGVIGELVSRLRATTAFADETA